MMPLKGGGTESLLILMLSLFEPQLKVSGGDFSYSLDLNQKVYLLTKLPGYRSNRICGWLQRQSKWLGK